MNASSASGLCASVITPSARRGGSVVDAVAFATGAGFSTLGAAAGLAAGRGGAATSSVGASASPSPSESRSSSEREATFFLGAGFAAVLGGGGFAAFAPAAGFFFLTSSEAEAPPFAAGFSADADLPAGLPFEASLDFDDAFFAMRARPPAIAGARGRGERLLGEASLSTPATRGHGSRLPPGPPYHP